MGFYDDLKAKPKPQSSTGGGGFYSNLKKQQAPSGGGFYSKLKSQPAPAQAPPPGPGQMETGMAEQRQRAEEQAGQQEQAMGLARQIAPAISPLAAPLAVWGSPLVMGALNQGTQVMAPAARDLLQTERKEDLADNLGPATRARLQEQGRSTTQHLESIKPTGTNDALDNPFLRQALGTMVPGYGNIAMEALGPQGVRDQLGNMRDAAEYLTGAQLHDDKDNFGPLTQRGLDRRGQTMQQRQQQILQSELARTSGGIEGALSRSLPIPTDLPAETTFDVGREAGMSPEIALATELVMDPQNIIEALPVARLAGMGRNLSRSLGVGDDLAEAFARGVDDTAAELGQKADITSAAPRALRNAEQAAQERAGGFYSQFRKSALETPPNQPGRRISLDQPAAPAAKAVDPDDYINRRAFGEVPESPVYNDLQRVQRELADVEAQRMRVERQGAGPLSREARAANMKQSDSLRADAQRLQAQQDQLRQVAAQDAATFRQAYRRGEATLPGPTSLEQGYVSKSRKVGSMKSVPPGKMRLYRASDDQKAGRNYSFSESVEDASAYLNNPGYGGNTLYRFDVDEKEILDLRNDREAWKIMSDLLGFEDGFKGAQSPLASRVAGVVHGIFDELGTKANKAVRDAGYDWVRYEDTFPERAVTVRYMGEEVLDGHRIGGAKTPKKTSVTDKEIDWTSETAPDQIGGKKLGKNEKSWWEWNDPASRQAQFGHRQSTAGPASLEQGYAPRAMQMGTPQPRPQPGPAGTPPNQTALVPSPSPAQLPPRKTLGDVIRTALGRPEPGQVKNVPQMIRNAAKTLEKMTGAKGVYGLGRSASSKTPARFLSGQNLIEIKRGNLKGWWHEVGHAFDEMAAKAGPAGKARPEGKFSRRSDLTSELDTLGSQGESSWQPGMDDLRRRQEGMAEFTRLWFENPEEARRLAPKTFDAYEKHLDELGDLGSEWRQHQAEMELWMTSDKAARAMAHVVERPDQKWRVGTLSETVAGLVNRYHPLKALDEVAAAFKGVKMLSPEDSMHVQARLMKNLSNLKIQEFQNQLKQALEPINAMGHKASAAFQKWLVARHAVEMEKAGLTTGRPLDEWEALVQAYDTPEFRQAADDLAAWQKSVNQYAIDEGNLDPLAVEGWEQKWKHYVPTNRELENVIGQVDPKPGFAGSGAKALKPGRGPGAWLHGKKGGQQAIYEPIETMLQNMQSTVYSTERNRMGKMLLRKLDEDTEGLGQFVREIKPGDKAGRRTVTFRDGDPASGTFRERTLEFTNEELFKAYTAMDEKSFGIVTRILGAPAQLLRYGATRIRLPFVLNNFERDTVGSALNSRVGSFPLAQSLDGLFTVLRSYVGDQAAKDVVEAFAKSGGKQGIDERYADPTSARKMYRDVLSSLSPTARALTIVPKPLQAGVKGVGTVIKSPITLLEYLSDLSEQATRLGEFKNARKFYAEQNPDWSQKAIDQQAGFEAMDLLDFDMRGNNEIVRWLRQIIPFLGSSMTGTYRTLQAMRENPKMFVAKSMGFLAIPTLGLYAMNRNNPYYWELTQQDRDSHWHIPMVEPLAKMLGITNPAEKFIRIKKPFLMGHIGGALWERAAQLLGEKDPKAFDGFAEAILTQSLPATVDDMGGPGLRMISEINNNYDSFRKRDIEPDWLRKGPGEIAPYQRSDEYSTITSRLFSQALAKIPGAPKFSPLQLDHIVRGMTGGGGEAVLKGRLFGNIPGLNRIGVDPLLSAATGMEEAKASRQQYLGQVPSEGRHESEDRFFKRLSALRQTVNDPANPEAKKMRGKLAQYENTEKRLKGYYKQRANAKDETQRARINRLIVRETERLEPPTGRQKELRQGAKPRE